MLIFLDCEGDPIQEFSAILVDGATMKIKNVFHQYVCYPKSGDSIIDNDSFSRRHIHGLNLDFLSQHGLQSEHELTTLFHQWLSKQGHIDAIYAHAPHKERNLLSLNIVDVCLKPWSERDFSLSHSVALTWKMNSIAINGVSCADAHASFSAWRPKNVKAPSQGDVVKMQFFHHCSLYDSLECYLYFVHEK